jgi:ABC-2 type transport system permease protein
VSAATRVRGPAALSGDWRRFVALSVTLALTEFKLRFFDSALGYLWTLMRPLLLFAVLYAVFSQVLDLGDEIAFYPVVLLTAIVLFEFFGETTGDAVTSVVNRENLVRKIHFPRMAIPVAVSLTATLNLLLNFVAVGVFLAAQGVEVRWSWLELPLLLALLIALATGVGMLLSALYVFLRDIKPIWEVFSRALFYATPVIWPFELAAERSEGLAQLLMCNPLAAIIQQMRHAVIDAGAPSAAEAIGGAPRLLVPAAILLAVCAAGFMVFNRLAPRIAEEL